MTVDVYTVPARVGQPKTLVASDVTLASVFGRSEGEAGEDEVNAHAELSVVGETMVSAAGRLLYLTRKSA